MFQITPITAAQVAALDEKLATGGTAVADITPADKPEPKMFSLYNKEHGIAADATYDPTGDGTLTVTVKKKPFLLPEAAIKTGIEEAINA